MKAFILLLLLLLAACTPAHVARPGSDFGVGQSLPVTGRDYGPLQQFAAYLKTDETTELGSVYVLFSGDRLCFVDGRTHAEVKDGQYFACDWRFARRG